MSQTADQVTRNMMLALYYLTGVLNKEQIEYLIDLEEPVPETWEKIVSQVKNITNKKDSSKTVVLSQKEINGILYSLDAIKHTDITSSAKDNVELLIKKLKNSGKNS